MLSPELEV